MFEIIGNAWDARSGKPEQIMEQHAEAMCRRFAVGQVVEITASLEELMNDPNIGGTSGGIHDKGMRAMYTKSFGHGTVKDYFYYPTGSRYEVVLAPGFTKVFPESFLGEMKEYDKEMGDDDFGRD